MQRAIDTFGIAIRRVHELGGLFSAVTRLTTSAVDPTDLLRSQIVLAVSALDHLVHELAVAGMLEIYDGVRQPTPAFQRFSVPLGAHSTAAQLQLSRTSFEAAVRDRHSYLSFQRPDKIADAIRLFSTQPLWDGISQLLSEDVATIKSRLNLAVDRRNKIAHEADMDPSYPGARWPISPRDVDGVTASIDEIGNAIYQVCK